MPTIRQFQVTFDCAEPARLAAFWCEVLGYVVPAAPEGFATWEEYHRSLPPEDEIYFACTDPSDVGPRLLALGAKHVLTHRADGVNESCITMQDIEGNEFCLD